MAFSERYFRATIKMLDVIDAASDVVAFGPYGRRIHAIVMECGKDIGSDDIAKVFIDKKMWYMMAPKVRKLCLFLDTSIIEEIRCAQTRYLINISVGNVISYKAFRHLLEKVNTGFEPGGWSPFPGPMFMDMEIMERLSDISQRVIWDYELFNSFFFGILRDYIFGLDGRGQLLSRDYSLRALALTSVIDACGGGKEWLGPVKVASLGLPASVGDEIVNLPFRPCAIYMNFCSTECYLE
jgi:hypothetical protein